jgi:cytochrome c553
MIRIASPIRQAMKTLLVVAAAAAIVSIGIVVNAQLATADRVRDAGWWPTKGTAARADYVGAAACSSCHRAQAASQPTTAMARTAAKAERSEILHTIDRLTFKTGDYSYEIVSNGQQSRYTVSNGAHAGSAPLAWAFGVGSVGQSFLFERDGAFHEARVSYYDAIHALGFTPGRALASLNDVDEAMGRRVSDGEVRRCFACHTTAPTTAGAFDASSATPGVTCEACHGPGRAHVAAMTAGQIVAGRAAILNPAKLTPEAAVDFCGSCHATFWDVALSGQQGIAALRSEPYRLHSSRCWTAVDARLTCTACHNPHEPLVKDVRAYDERCLRCHVTSGTPPTRERAGHACPVAMSACASCHMPKYAVPDMHHEFTDHLIRIVRP